MSKFNQAGVRTATSSVIQAERTASGVTFEGGPGFARDLKSELFLLAVSNFVGEDTFYEKAGQRDDRYSTLVRQIAVADADWLVRFVRWLRTDANMRSASLVAAGEGVKARLEAGLAGGSRQLVAAALHRADEPGEFLGYWTSKYGRALPKPVKRGISDAVARLYTEYALLKYDTASKGYRFGDVIDLVHPAPAADRPWQGNLFQHALDRRHNRDDMSLDGLPMVAANAALRARAADDASVLLDPEALKAAGMTWEDALSLAGSRVDKAQLWSALVPSLPYMAALRNLRNLDEAGVPDDVAEQLAARLADPAQVARSMQLPFRFLSAYEAAPSVRWSHALDKALTASLSNLPSLPGRSLILVDTSASMQNSFSARSKVSAAKAAAVFGVALAAKGEQVDLHGFADRTFAHPVRKGASVIREIGGFLNRTGEVGHGTEIAGSLRATYRGHDRVFLISDMQTVGGNYGHGVSESVPANVPLYAFNISGYQHGAIPSGAVPNRYEFGGLTDATFRMVPLLEAGRNAGWPF